MNKPKVSLVTYTPNPEEVIEKAGRVCYDTMDRFRTNPSRIQDWIKVGHESMLEHASATFQIIASRVFTHEIVRHRIASYSQRSQRYVFESLPEFYSPPQFDDEANKLFEELMDNCWSVYKELISRGYKKELARYVLPNACLTTIVCTWNFRELRHIIKLRTSSRALPEMREVATQILDICREIAPNVFEDL